MALLALNNPIAVIFAGIFMAMLKIVGQQLTNLTAYNEYITDVIIAVIVYLSAFSLVIRMMLSGRKKKKGRGSRHGSHPSGRRRGGSDLPAAGGGESTRRGRCHRQR